MTVASVFTFYLFIWGCNSTTDRKVASTNLWRADVADMLMSETGVGRYFDD